MDTKQDQKSAMFLERLAQARAAGVSGADLAMSAVLLNSVLAAMKDLMSDPKQAMVAGIMLGGAMGASDQQATDELLKVIGVMFDEQEALDHVRLEMVPTYLEKRREMLAVERASG